MCQNGINVVCNNCIRFSNFNHTTKFKDFKKLIKSLLLTQFLKFFQILSKILKSKNQL